VMTQVDLGLTSVSRFYSADSAISTNDARVGRPQLGPKAHQTGKAAPWQILDVNLFRRFPLTQNEFWHETGAIGSSMKIFFQPYIERP
jgi:hypothetical protein